MTPSTTPAPGGANPTALHAEQARARRVWRLTKVAELVLVGVLLASPLIIRNLFLIQHRPNGLATVWIPMLILGNLALIRVVAGGDRRFVKLLSIALLFKVAATAMYISLTFDLYGRADNLKYFDFALAMNEGLDPSRFFANQRIWGTRFVQTLTGYIVAIFGRSFSTAMILFSVCAFWGQVFFFALLRRVSPQADVPVGAALFLFFPSLVFWSASIGKEALIILGLAGFAWGMQLMSERISIVSVSLAGLGLGLVTLVRPHISAMLAFAAVAGFTVARRGRGLQGLGSKLTVVVVLGATAVVAILQAQTFLRMDELSVAETTEFLDAQMERTAIGGSAMDTQASLLQRVVYGPFLVIRPFPWEATSATGVISSLEGLVLLGLAWNRRRQLFAAVKAWRQSPFVAFVLVYSLEFLIVFSSISNWGIIARQRTMLIPFVFLLLAALEPE